MVHFYPKAQCSVALPPGLRAHFVPHCFQFLGLHSHKDSVGHDHADGENSGYTLKLLVLLAGIYYFYLMETIFTLVTHKGQHSHRAVRVYPLHAVAGVYYSHEFLLSVYLGTA